MAIKLFHRPAEPKETIGPVATAPGASLEDVPMEIYQKHILPHYGKEEWVALKRTSRTLRVFTAGDSKWERLFRRTFSGGKPPSFPTYESAHNCLFTNLSRGICAKKSFGWILEPAGTWFAFCEGKSIVAIEHPEATLLNIRNMEDSELIGVASALPDVPFKSCAIRNGHLYAIFHHDHSTIIKVWESPYRRPLFTKDIPHAQPTKLSQVKIGDDGVLFHFEGGRICFATLEHSELVVREVPILIGEDTSVIFSQGKIILDPKKLTLESHLRIFDEQGTLEQEISFTKRIVKTGSISQISTSERFCVIVLKQKIDGDRCYTVWAFDIDKQEWLKDPIFESDFNTDIFEENSKTHINYFHVSDQLLLLETESNRPDAIPFINKEGQREMKFMVFDLGKIAKDRQPVFTDIVGIDDDGTISKRVFDQGKYYSSFNDKIIVYDFTQSQEKK